MTCSLCGDDKPLTPDGVCQWRSGCEHRQMQARAASDRFDADYRHHFEPLPCGHTRSEHEAQWREIISPAQPPHVELDLPSSVQRFLDEYMGPDEP